MLIPSSHASGWLYIPDTRLTWNEGFIVDGAPSIAQAQDGRIWIAWHSLQIIDTNLEDICYKVYNGSWSSTQRLTTNPDDADITPSITTADGNIWVVWSSNRDENFEIYYNIYDGSSWLPDDTRLTTNSSVDEFPSVMQDTDGDIWVVWSSNRNGNFEIHYQIYDNKTKAWQSIGQLTSNSTSSDRDPSIMQDQDGKVWIAWERDEDIYYKVVFKNMTVKVDDTPLTMDSNMDLHPSIMQDQDDKVWIAWAAERLEIGNHTDIYCKIYDVVWSEERITSDNADDIMPTIMQDANGTIWIAWTSTRLSNFDIYYKTGPPPQHIHDIAIISVTPSTTNAYQGLEISIEVAVQNQGAEPEDFQVSCYANSTLIGSQTAHLSAGQIMPINFIWNTLNVPLGTYVISANASIVSGGTDTDPADNTLFDGVIQIKVRIPGDANLDGLVELDDFYIWRENFGRTQGEWPPDEYPDFDDNGFVDLWDFYVWVENIGATA